MILRDWLGRLGRRVPTEEAPGPQGLIIHNDRAKRELGWSPRSAETTIVETAKSLRDHGLTTGPASGWTRPDSRNAVHATQRPAVYHLDAYIREGSLFL